MATHASITGPKYASPVLLRSVVSDEPLLTGPVAVHTSCEVCGSVGAWDTCPPSVEGFVELHNAVLVLIFFFFFDCLNFPGG